MNRVGSVLGAAMVIAIAVVFVVNFRPGAGAQQPTSGPTCAVEVRGSCVSSTQFWASYGMLAPRNADRGKLKALGLRRITMDGLVERWLLVEDAKRLGLTVSEEDLSAELRKGRVHVSVPAEKMRSVGERQLGLGEDGTRLIQVKDRKTKEFDEKVYQREVRMVSKMHPKDFREFQREELLAARMRDLVRSRVRVGENEAFEQFAREKATASVEYARFDRRFYADLVLDRSDRTVDAWSLSHKDEIDKVWENRKSKFMPECRVFRHVLAKVSEEADDESGKAEAKKRIEAVIARLGKGESFEDVARTASDDSSSVRGGDLGCVTKGQMVKPFEEAAFALEPGKTSGIVETEYGFHVVKLEKIAKDADAEQMGKKQVTLELYLAHESERIASDTAKSVVSAVRGGKTLAEAVEAHLADLRPKKKKDDKKDGDAEKGDTKKDDAPSRAITIDTHPFRPAVDSSLPFNASGEPIPGAKPGSDLPTIAFKLEKPGAVADDIVPLETGYAVMVLKEKTAATKEAWEKDREYYMSAMRAAKQNDALVGYLKRLRTGLGSEVKFNQSLANEAKDKEGETGEPDAPLEE